MNFFTAAIYLVCLLYISLLLSIPGQAQSKKNKGAPPGDYAGNGGEIVVCGAAVEGDLFQLDSGYYSHDYVQSRDAYEFVEPTSLDQSFDRIDGLLANIKNVQEQFREYRRLIKNDSIRKGKRIWTISGMDVKRVDDSRAVRNLPRNCLTTPENPNQGVFQLAVRVVEGNIVFYEVNKSFLEKLEKFPLQISMFFIHEMMWDYSDSAFATRKFNVQLHQVGATAADVELMFKELFSNPEAKQSESKVAPEVAVSNPVPPANQPVPTNPAPLVNPAPPTNPAPRTVISRGESDREKRMIASYQRFIENDAKVAIAYVNKRANDIKGNRFYSKAHSHPKAQHDDLQAQIDYLNSIEDLEKLWWAKFKKEENAVGNHVDPTPTFIERELIRQNVNPEGMEVYYENFDKVRSKLIYVRETLRDRLAY